MHPALGEGFEDVSVRDSIAADLALIDHYDVVIGELELAVLHQARVHDPNAFRLLTTLPGIGRILGLTILYEIQDIRRFPSVQDFASYCRLVKCEKNSAGKKLGTGGDKIGNAYLKWAFSEAAVLFVTKCAQGRTMLTRLERKHPKSKALQYGCRPELRQPASACSTTWMLPQEAFRRESRTALGTSTATNQWEGYR